MSDDSDDDTENKNAADGDKKDESACGSTTANVVDDTSADNAVHVTEVSEAQAKKFEADKSELERILASNNLEAVSDSEDELEDLQLQLPNCPLQIDDNMTTLPLGTVTSVIGKEMAVVQSVLNSRAVDVNTLVVTADRKVVGIVVDTFGTVKQCMYSVALTEDNKKKI